METWKATIKERGNGNLLTPEYHLSNQFDYIKDERLRESEIRKFLVEFWGLDNEDVEWYQLEKINTWSEEDELHIKELESLVKRVWAIGEHENDKDTIHKMSDLSFFLKTLKPQPKQEWSEEDEKHVNDLIAYFTADMSLKHTEEDIANWLKSLRPQPQWKPSDEQMEALGDINLTGNISYAGQGQELINLYNDLKKLKK